jgi:hypothetical protein
MSDTEGPFAGLPTSVPVAPSRSGRAPAGWLLRVTIYVAVLQTLSALAIDNVTWAIAPAFTSLAGIGFWLYLPSAVADAVLCVLCLTTGRRNYRVVSIVALVLLALQLAYVVVAIVRFANGPAPWDF